MRYLDNMNPVRVLHTKFISEGETVRGNFVVPPGEGPFPGICKFHGFPGSPDQTSGIATRLAKAGFAVLTFDFRGFRQSEGLFRISGEMTDASNAVTHLMSSDFTVGEWVGVLGASFGGAISICSAARDSRISAVCVRAPVYDIRALSKSSVARFAIEEIYTMNPDFIHGLEDTTTRANLIQWMDDDSQLYNPVDDIKKISPRPIFIITGDEDPLIDVAGVKHLFEVAGDPKDLVIVEGADHGPSDPRAYQITVDTIADWFLRVYNV